LTVTYVDVLIKDDRIVKGRFQSNLRQDIRIMRNFDIIKEAVERNIPESTLTLIKRHFEGSTLIRGAPENFYNGLSREQGIYFILFYLLKHGDHRLRSDALRDNFDLNKNAIADILDRFSESIDQFNLNNLTKRSNEDLLDVASRFVGPSFRDIHALIDGVHIKVLGLDKEVTGLFPDSFRSHKFNYKNAVSFQVCIGADLRAEWCDQGNAAGCADMRCLWRSDFHLMFANCNILGDTGYINSYYPINIITKYKAPRGGALTQEQVNYNYAHGQERNPIERLLGILKSRFEFLQDGYRGPLHH
jgi:hypothetical protein